MSEFLTVSEMARMLSVTPRTVQRLIVGGHLSAIKLPGANGTYRISRDAVNSMLRERATQPKDTIAA